ncbi:MAG: tetratricopeptide repeat protein [Acidobacteria bacterium]|nr:tetratricopeptide repeat protein [Acidobacteriota bacterium]MBI3282180.1 tetratricopeptide repeat protein [Acidobacteriota bacterium]
MRRQAVNALEAGEGDLRLAGLRRKVLAEPDSLPARLELAREYARTGYPDLAVEHYRLAAARFPDSEEVQIVLARTLRSLGMAAEAAKGLSAWASGRTSVSWAAISWLGILYDEAGSYPLAETQHRAALSRQPDADVLHNNLGYNLLLQGKREQAAAEFRRALELNQGSQVARNNLGIALAASPAEAIRLWEAGGDTATAHNNLAAVLIQQGRFSDARKELDVALRYKKDHPAALSNLQLISEIDGQPMAVTGSRPVSRWKRVGSTLARVVFGAEDSEQPEQTSSK